MAFAVLCNNCYPKLQKIVPAADARGPGEEKQGLAACGGKTLRG
jgi:hypothetical protein